MIKLLVLLSLFIVLSQCATSSLHKSSRCYNLQNVCVPQEEAVTGVKWKDCSDYCRNCKGMMGGECKRQNSDDCKNGYKCQCSGKPFPKTDNLKIAATCRLGL
ncbi:hypothetical protein WR25_01427 [Diploscapter pachys]|uniref:Uncharacterized protein n=1 Tax=Diploscapter pachys TaxID=2018661 RepID=A0A2A2JP86_9BILA|nr:hypothetical protein WR25_01427 [Diploscapter pachys]